MFEVSVKTRFSAAHHLVGYGGSCADQHGHNWGVKVVVSGSELNETGILVDFRVLREAVKGVLDQFDHKDLNTIDFFKSVNPSSENIAKFLFDRLSSELDCESYSVDRVSVSETPESKAVYRRGLKPET